jgi:hypothetical protein
MCAMATRGHTKIIRPDDFCIQISPRVRLPARLTWLRAPVVELAQETASLAAAAAA